MTINYCKVSCTLDEILRLQAELGEENGLISVVENGSLKWKLVEMELLATKEKENFFNQQRDLVNKLGTENEAGVKVIKRFKEKVNEADLNEVTTEFKEYEKTMNELLSIEKEYDFPVILLTDIEKMSFKGYPKAFFSIVKKCNQ